MPKVGSNRSGGTEWRKRLDVLQKLITDMICPVPDEWLSDENRRNSRSNQMRCKNCTDYKKLQTAWKKALKWTDGLDRALSVMLAAVTSTKVLGDQLWIKVLGPASCGKSTLCEALSVNADFVLAKSTIRGFHSGYQTNRKGDEDHSLVSKLDGKTLITKDGDTLLQAPNLSQILAEARDLYDCTSRTHYRNSTSRDYSGVRMTWLLCGTSSLRSIDQSELGERFLDCVIMDGIDPDLEEEILWRAANKADRNMSFEANGKPETQYDPELASAMALTGGYVNHLRQNAVDLLGSVQSTDDSLRRCMHLGKFVAYMRARPSASQEESAERELAARLVSQHIRLAKCLAVVLNRDSLDDEVMRRVQQVAMDTARGQTRDIAKLLYEEEEGLEVQGLSVRLGLGDRKTRELLRFLKKIEAVEVFRPVKKTKTKKLLTGAFRWRLTTQLRSLYETVVVES